MTGSLETFVTRLAQTACDGPVFNQYADQAAGHLAQANAIRRANLRLYLAQMAAARPALLLVGEAPGYRGCRLTGIPFTSEEIVLDDHIGPFGRRAGYRKTTEHARIVKEASATMLWSAANGLSPPPLLWNAFPFHPHRPGEPLSNRRPRSDELRLGAQFLSALLALFRPLTIAAVGRSAAAALSFAGRRDYRILRHPSHGGKAAFCAGLQKITAQG